MFISSYSKVDIDLLNELKRHEICPEKVLTVTFSLIRRQRTCRDKTEDNGVRIRVWWFDNYVAGLRWWLVVTVASPCTK